MLVVRGISAGFAHAR